MPWPSIAFRPILRTSCIDAAVLKYRVVELEPIHMAQGQRGRSMDKVTPRYASSPGHRSSNDGMEGFDRIARIVFLLSIPVLGVLIYFGWTNGWL